MPPLRPNRINAILWILTAASVVTPLTFLIPAGRIVVVNDSAEALLDVEVDCRCARTHVDVLAPGDTVSLWFWGCGETGVRVSFADESDQYDQVDGGYLDPAPSGALAVRIGDDAAHVERMFLIASVLPIRLSAML